MRRVSTDADSIRRSKRISDAGLLGSLGAAGVLYVSGLTFENPHARETGWLAGQAVLNGLVVNTAIQQVTRRQRPESARNPGEWWDSGSSFPSNHAMGTWAAATVIANEYPGVATRTLAYGTAAAVSVTRVLAYKHSPSDVFIGSTIGYLIGRQVYRAHHDPDLPGSPVNKSESMSIRWVRAPYVPIESNLYALVNRLAGSGLIDSAFLGQRPWTRAEFARIVNEAEAHMTSETDPVLVEAFGELRREFETELREGMEPERTQPVETIYSRLTGIGGTPLRDDYHFGRTLSQDYGRPYWEGANAIVGVSGSAGLGFLKVHVRGEYQYAPGGPTYSPSTLAYLANVDRTSEAIRPSADSISDFRLVEAYASTSWRKVALTVGKQSLWWGPTEVGPWLYSNNAEPIYMGRLSLQSPIVLPGFLGYLGPLTMDGFFGKLAGHLYPRGPYIHGQKITLKPTPNLELGFSRTVVFAGEGRPLTFRSFWRSFASFGSNVNTIPGSKLDVGDRRGGFDFSYRVPGLRTWLTVYGDAFTDDDPSPISAPHRAAFNLGFYVPRFPGMSKLDLRVEAPISDRPATQRGTGNVTFFYYNGAYLDGYTNKQVLLGNPVGRNAKGVSAASRYWFTPERKLELGFRQTTVSQRFLSGGGNYLDARVGFDTPILGAVTMSSFVQYERWNFPLLAPRPQRDVTGSLMLTYRFDRLRK